MSSPNERNPRLTISLSVPKRIPLIGNPPFWRPNRSQCTPLRLLTSNAAPEGSQRSSQDLLIVRQLTDYNSKEKEGTFMDLRELPGIIIESSREVWRLIAGERDAHHRGVQKENAG